MTTTNELITRFLAQSDAVSRVIAGLSREEMTRPMPPGAWSLQQLAVHLYDSDLVGCDRMRRIIAMEKPLLVAYDETAFVARLGYDKIDTETAAEGFRVNRVLLGQVLRAAPPEAFARVGVHSERGLLSLEQMVDGYIKHVDHHMTFANGKRKALGKPVGV